MRHLWTAATLRLGFGLAVLGSLVLINLTSLHTLREVQASRATLLAIQQLSLTHATLAAPIPQAETVGAAGPAVAE